MTWLPTVGLPELLVVLAVTLVLFGGSRLPKAGRTLGRAIRGFKNALAEVSQDTTGSEPPTGPESDAQ